MPSLRARYVTSQVLRTSSCAQAARDAQLTSVFQEQSLFVLIWFICLNLQLFQEKKILMNCDLSNSNWELKHHYGVSISFIFIYPF